MGNTADTPQDRSIHISGGAEGSAIVTGDHNTVTVGTPKITLPAPDTVDMNRELEALRRTLAALDVLPRIRVSAVARVEGRNDATTGGQIVKSSSEDPRPGVQVPSNHGMY